MMSTTKFGGKVLVLDYNHEKIVWEPEIIPSMKFFYSSFLKWRSDAGMDNAIADNLPNLFNNAGLNDISISQQHEVINQMDNNYHSRIRICFITSCCVHI